MSQVIVVDVPGEIHVGEDGRVVDLLEGLDCTLNLRVHRLVGCRILGSVEISQIRHPLDSLLLGRIRA